jgi:site-specific DNA-cytosine methylase
LLTAAACRGIIRREEKNGRDVSPELREALEDTIRLWCNAGEVSDIPEEKIFAPRFVPKPESIREAIRTGQYSVARNLTWTEWERLMGFPDGWTVVEGDC